MRHGLNSDLGFTAEARNENIRRVAEVAKLAYEHGNIVLCTFISPYIADREAARALVQEGGFWEVYVKCDVEVCKQRDPRGCTPAPGAVKSRTSPVSRRPTRSRPSRTWCWRRTDTRRTNWRSGFWKRWRRRGLFPVISFQLLGVVDISSKPNQGSGKMQECHVTSC